MDEMYVRGDDLVIKSLFLKDSSTLCYSCSFSILLHYVFPISSLWRVFHIILSFSSHFHRTFVHHPTLYSSMCLIKHLLWLSVNGNGWDHCSEVFSTLMRPVKSLQCIQCGSSSFSLRYFCILILSVRAWNLSLLLESLGRSPKSPGCLLDWYSSDPRKVTSSDLSPPLFLYVTIYSGVSPVIYSYSDASPLVNRAKAQCTNLSFCPHNSPSKF